MLVTMMSLRYYPKQCCQLNKIGQSRRYTRFFPPFLFPGLYFVSVPVSAATKTMMVAVLILVSILTGEMLYSHRAFVV